MGDAGKKAAASKAADIIASMPDIKIIGIGTGSTVGYFINELHDRGILADKIFAASSLDTALKLSKKGFRVLEPSALHAVDVYIDGADEVDPEGRMIKGRGGAHIGEKILAFSSRLNMFIIDEDKLVKRLGERRPLPLSVDRAALGTVLEALRAAGIRAEIRVGGCKDGPCIDERGSIILDLYTGPIEDPLLLEYFLETLPGVVGTGLFIGYADIVIIGRDDGRVEVRKHRRWRGLGFLGNIQIPVRQEKRRKL